MTISEQLALYCSEEDGLCVGARLQELPYVWRVLDLDVSGKFFYLTFNNHQPTLEEFIDYLSNRIVDFCLPQRMVEDAKRKYRDTKDARIWPRMRQKAARLFIDSPKQQRTTGEPAELILFIILTCIMKAPQIACKMHLKTSTAMPVYGADAIHIGEKEGEFELYWGEAKLMQQLSKALDDTCLSIRGFLECSATTGIQREREIDIIMDHFSLPEGPLKEAILKQFDPYDPYSTQFKETYACFCGFNFEALNRLPEGDCEGCFREAYLERVKTGCKLFEEKIREHDLRDLDFVFFLLPFADIEELRIKFLEKIRALR